MFFDQNSWTRRQSLPRPFGVRGPNDLTFARSYKTPNSNLSKIVKFLRTRDNVPATKRELVGIALNRPDVFANTKSHGRGWSSTFFRYAVQAKFIVKERKGKTFVYSLGETANRVL